MSNGVANGMGEALARIPSGVSILTATYGDRSTGMLASWIQQASFRPPMISVCVKRGRPILGLITPSQCFCLNVVGEGDSSLMKHFGSGFSIDDDAFTGLNIEGGPFGVLLRDAIAHLQCSSWSPASAKWWKGRFAGQTRPMFICAKQAWPIDALQDDPERRCFA